MESFVFSLSFFFGAQQRSCGQTRGKRGAFGNRGESLKKKKKKTKEELFLRDNEEENVFFESN
jgi:hypothetical protein